MLLLLLLFPLLLTSITSPLETDSAALTIGSLEISTVGEDAALAVDSVGSPVDQSGQSVDMFAVIVSFASKEDVVDSEAAILSSTTCATSCCLSISS